MFSNPPPGVYQVWQSVSDKNDQLMCSHSWEQAKDASTCTSDQIDTAVLCCLSYEAVKLQDSQEQMRLWR